MATRNFNVKNGLTVGNVTIDAATSNANIGNIGTGRVIATGNVSATQFISNIATGTAPLIVTSTTLVANLNAATAGTAGTVTANAQPNITSVGTLTDLTVSGVTNLGNVGNVIITGGSSGFYLQTNGSGNLTWAAVPSGNGIANGTSNVSVPVSGGNVNTSVAGNANVFVVTGTGVNVAGTLNATGNANVGNIGATGVFATTLGGSLTTAAQPNITSVGTLTALSVTGNVTAGNLIGPHANGNSNVNIPTANGNINLSVAGTANVAVVTGTGMNVAGTLNATGNANVGNLGTARVLASANITAPQLISNVATGTAPLVVSSTTQVANLNAATAGTAGTVTTAAQPNITSVGTLTSLAVSGNTTSANFVGALANGNSSVNIPVANGNVNISAVGTANVVVITATGANVAGTLNATGNANVGNLGTTGQIIATGNVTSNANVVTNNIIGRTGALTIASGGTNTDIVLAPNGTGNIDANNAYITNVKTPLNLNDAATKSYVDSLVSTGIQVHPSVVAATTGTLATASGGTVTYNNGTAGVGATLTTTGTFNLIDTANVQTVGTRILVKNEANAAWNGIYTYTNTTTLTRAVDADSYGAGDPNSLGQNDYFFVSDGQVNLNSSWICSTTGTITFGTTNIVFSQFSAVQAYTAGTGLTLSTGLEFSISNTTVTAGTYGNGDRVATFTVNNQGQLTAASNVAITANAANLTGTTLNSTIVNSSLTSVGTLGSLTVTGNVSAGNFIGVFANGNSTISIPAANGNITLSAGGTPSELVITSTGVNVAGTLNANGNANVGNLGTAQVLATANVTAPQLISNVATGTAPFVVTSTTQVANLSVATAGTATTAGTVTTAAQPNITSVGTLTSLTVSGNLTAGNLIGPHANGNSNVNMPAANGNINLSVAGNANVLVVTGTGVNVAGTLNATGNANVGNLGATGVVATTLGGSLTTATQPNITSIGTLSSLTVTGNVTAGNLIGPHANGNSNVNMPAANGNVTVSVAGNANVAVFTGTGVNVAGTLNATGNANVGNIGATNAVITTVNTGLVQNGTSNVTIASGGNVSTFIGGNATAQLVVTSSGANIAGTLNAVGNANVGNLGAAAGVFTANVTAGNVYANSGTIGASLLTGTLTTASQPNITSLGTLSSLTVSGNITSGNVRLNGGLTSNRSNVSIGTNTVIDQFAPSSFRTAKYVISASGDNGFQSIETLLVHDGVDAYITIYGSISSNVSSEIVNLSANINGVSGNVSLYASNIGANVRVNLVSSYIQI